MVRVVAPLVVLALTAAACSGGGGHRAASTSSSAIAGATDGGSATTASPTGSSIAGDVSGGSDATTTATTAKAKPKIVGTPGASTIGDELFPALGNGGYDVNHYDLSLDWHQNPAQLVAVATIDATAGSALSELFLDFTGLDLDAVTVDGAAAEAHFVDEKLDITPAAAIAKGAKFTTVVRYHGDPGLTHGGSRTRTGWFTVPDGAYTLDEPDGAHHWFPADDHPLDKATFTFHVTVDAGVNVVTNGRETGRTAQDGRLTITSSATEPMAAYLAVVAIGPYTVTTAPGPHGSTLREVVPTSGPVTAGSLLPVVASQLAFFEQSFGPLPFDTYGVLLAPSQAGIALETQTLSTFSAADFPGPPNDDPSDPAVQLAQEMLAHELAHQWFGDAVSPAHWRDVWLSEGFATYAQWLWASQDDPTVLEERAQAARSHSAAVRGQYGATDDPVTATLFSPAVYDLGAMVLHALRGDVGDEVFFRTLQHWVQAHRFATGTTDDFIALASKEAGHDVGPLLHLWLSSTDPLPAFPGS
jgi:aminopeptidase N